MASIGGGVELTWGLRYVPACARVGLGVVGGVVGWGAIGVDDVRFVGCGGGSDFFSFFFFLGCVFCLDFREVIDDGQRSEQLPLLVCFPLSPLSGDFGQALCPQCLFLPPPRAS